MRTKLFAASAVAALLLSQPALAQASDATDIQEVIVTARAGTEAQRKVEASYAITTVSEERLRLQSPVSVAEVLRNVPGFWVEASGGVGGANIRARGIPIEGYAAVGLQEDGLPVQHDGGLGFLNSDFSFRMDETVQRVEVVRGGPSSIFASYAPAGVVNFITRKPGDSFEGVAKAEVGDYGLYRGDLWLGGPVAGFRVGLGGFYREDDGVRNPGWTGNKGGQVRFSIGRDFQHGSLDFNVKHTDDNNIFYLAVPLTFDSNGDTAEIPGFNANYGTLAGPETARVALRTNRGTREFDQTRGSDLQLTQYTLTGRLDLGGWRLTNGLRFRTSDLVRTGFYPNTPASAASRISQDVARVAGGVSGRLTYLNGGAAFDVANQNGTGLVMDAFLREQDITLDEWVDDLRIQRRFDVGSQSHDVAFGVYFARDEETFYQQGAAVLTDVRENARLLTLQVLNASGQVIATTTENGVSRYGSQFNNAEGESQTWALYASDEWRITDELRIDLGARWERIEMSGRNERSSTINLGQSASLADDQAISGAGVYDALDREFDGWAATVGVNYQFQPDVGAFARYTRAFRLPSLGDFITNPTNTAPRTQQFDLAEAGFKVSKPAFDFYATAFYSGFDSQGFTETRFDQATNSFVSRTEFAATRAWGLELEGQARPTSWFDLGFNATLQDPRLGDFIFNERVARVGGACPLPSDTPTAVGDCLRSRDFSNNLLIRTPKVSTRIRPAVNLLDGRLRLEAEWQWYGKRYSDLANTTVIPEYQLINAQVRYNISESLAAYAYGTNLTNEIGLTEGNPRAGQFVSGEAGARYYLARPELGRTFRAALLYRF
ncbi:TonB-dependent receptor [Phenylobacterium deserti]|uniref:Cyclic nucleotide-binding protein n=1 Tax=Phenylobacterium deserti TaxID=1914756 RepID=A0A328AC60_9CAUL|nr:TonB-dependent receptor [Phenylobacterium deserti]RAK52195.1 cyclic nucleotide-binding protein [Phenylobacterium deserti]